MVSGLVDVSTSTAPATFLAELPSNLSQRSKDLWRTHVPLLIACARFMRAHDGPVPQLHLFKLLAQWIYNKLKGGVDVFSKFMEHISRAMDGASIKGYESRIIFRFGFIAVVTNALLLSRIQRVDFKKRRKNLPVTLDWIRREMAKEDCTREVQEAGLAIIRTFAGPHVRLQVHVEETDGSLASVLDTTPVRTAPLHMRMASTPTMVLPADMDAGRIAGLVQQYYEVAGMTAKARSQFFRTDPRSYDFRTTNVLAHELIPRPREQVEDESVSQPSFTGSGDRNNKKARRGPPEQAMASAAGEASFASSSTRSLERTPRTRCVMCTNQTTLQCRVCFVGLCHSCFTPFHQQKEVKNDDTV